MHTSPESLTDCPRTGLPCSFLIRCAANEQRGREKLQQEQLNILGAAADIAVSRGKLAEYEELAEGLASMQAPPIFDDCVTTTRDVVVAGEAYEAACISAFNLYASNVDRAVANAKVARDYCEGLTRRSIRNFRILKMPRICITAVNFDTPD